MKKYVLIFFTVCILASAFAYGSLERAFVERDTSMVPNAKKITTHGILPSDTTIRTDLITEYYLDGTMHKRQRIVYASDDYKARDTSMYNTKGQRIFHEEIEYEDIESDTYVINTLGLYEFDALGNVVKEELVTSSDYLKTVWFYEYNEDGQITVEKEYSGYSYKKKNIFPDYLTQYIYDENKKLIEKKLLYSVSLAPRYPGSSFYYDDGLIRTLNYPHYALKDPKDNELIGDVYSDSYLPIKEITIYENKFLKYRMYTYGSEKQASPGTLEEMLDTTVIYEVTYDERGNQLFFTCYTADMSEVWDWYEYEYSNYDAQENWTKRIIRNGETGKTHYTTTRSIEYWSDSELEGGNAQRATIYNAIYP